MFDRVLQDKIMFLVSEIRGVKPGSSMCISSLRRIQDSLRNDLWNGSVDRDVITVNRSERLLMASMIDAIGRLLDEQVIKEADLKAITAALSALGSGIDPLKEGELMKSLAKVGKNPMKSFMKELMSPFKK